ncbi:kinase-like domain-containing protein [Phycomyces blakesleeanus]|uniref:Kinase-like domain-containing protein n=1 Tax=Phycomyces blakesleeanus TaxID=4837 RepID=A0ABR3AJ88_PHYBL
MQAVRKKRNFKNLALDNSPLVAVPPSDLSVKSGKQEEYDELYKDLSDLQIGLELRLDLRTEDLETLEELGAGNGGTVTKVMHIPTKTIMAKKLDQRLMVRRQIMREMQFLHDCNSEHIVSFYGAFMNGGDISMCMEYMDVGSLDKIYKESGPIPMNVLKKIAYAIVDGLIYLYDSHRIIHRDLKPCNVLVNSAGQIKICDFGVSGRLIDSVANTFVGTSSYMSPERILGSPYSVKSDVWSIGITLMELALGRFPFAPENKPLAIFELLQHIVNEPEPTLPKQGNYPEDLHNILALWYDDYTYTNMYI